MFFSFFSFDRRSEPPNIFLTVNSGRIAPFVKCGMLRLLLVYFGKKNRVKKLPKKNSSD